MELDKRRFVYNNKSQYNDKLILSEQEYNKLVIKWSETRTIIPTMDKLEEILKKKIVMDLNPTNSKYL